MSKLLAVGELLPDTYYIMSQAVAGGDVANASAKPAVCLLFSVAVSQLPLLCLHPDESRANCTPASTDKS